MQWAARGGRREGAGLTVDSELKVLGLLAGWAEGHALVPPFIPQVTGGDSENLAVLLQLDSRVPRKDRSGKMVKIVSKASWQGQATQRGACCLGNGSLEDSQSLIGTNNPSAHQWINR